MRIRIAAAAVALAVTAVGCVAPPPAPASTTASKAPAAARAAAPKPTVPGIELTAPDLDQLRFEHSVLTVSGLCADATAAASVAVDEIEQAADAFLAVAGSMDQAAARHASDELIYVWTLSWRWYAVAEELEGEVRAVWLDPEIEWRIQQHHVDAINPMFNVTKSLSDFERVLVRFSDAAEWAPVPPEYIEELRTLADDALTEMRQETDIWAAACAEGLTLERARLPR